MLSSQVDRRPTLFFRTPLNHTLHPHQTNTSLPTQLFALLSFSLLPLALSTPISLLSRQDSCADVCGNTCYTSSDVSAAVSAGYDLYTSGLTEGSRAYPHEYYDRDGFSLAVAGPYYEFPILNSHEVYGGGSPGADRVVFNDNGDLAGLITHQGAGGNNFLQCS